MEPQVIQLRPRLPLQQDSTVIAGRIERDELHRRRGFNFIRPDVPGIDAAPSVNVCREAGDDA